MGHDIQAALVVNLPIEYCNFLMYFVFQIEVHSPGLQDQASVVEALQLLLLLVGQGFFIPAAWCLNEDTDGGTTGDGFFYPSLDFFHSRVPEKRGLNHDMTNYLIQVTVEQAPEQLVGECLRDGRIVWLFHCRITLIEPVATAGFLQKLLRRLRRANAENTQDENVAYWLWLRKVARLDEEIFVRLLHATDASGKTPFIKTVAQTRHPVSV